MVNYRSDKNHHIDLYNADCVEVMDKLISEGIQVDLTVTSPPYDDLRTYEDKSSWNFETFKPIAERLYKLTRDGGVVVWVVGDATVNGSETGSSFRQALYFMELGFKLHDTMIYQKSCSPFPAPPTSKRYTQVFEYMFVFVKGKIRSDIQLLVDRKNEYAGFKKFGKQEAYSREGELVVNEKESKEIPEYGMRYNIWYYVVGSVTGDDKTEHPAVFPEKLAKDHILSWSVEGDTVFDPFLGSGTTGKMAILNNRKFIGCEISDNYFEIAKNRIMKYDSPLPMATFMDGDILPEHILSENTKKSAWKKKDSEEISIEKPLF